nr:carboxy terminal-processing peptidase [Saprospiraceae bacterium]
MNFRNISLSIAAVGISLMFLAGQVFPDMNSNASKENVLLQYVMTYLDRIHFEPLELNEEFSHMVFEEYLNRLDGNKRYFIEEDIRELETYKNTIHHEVQAHTFGFFERANQLMEKAVDRANTIFTEVIETDFDFDSKEYYDLDSDNVEYAADLDELRERWLKFVHFQVLDEVVKKMKRAENNEEEIDMDEMISEAKENVKERSELSGSDGHYGSPLISDARENVRERIATWFERVSKTTKEDRFNNYINTISNLHDPHTGYFKPKDKQDFDMRMSNQLEGIGARLTSEGDYVKIVEVVPGGPAWKQGDLDPNDLILKVAQEGEDPVDITGWSLDDVVSIIRGPKGTKVTLTVRKIGNKEEEIEITRDVVVFEEGYARSAILEREGLSASVGYINLPSFYFNIGGGGDGRNSKDDVRQELLKLREEGVDGIILDLRNNGGGSLNDVVDMSGFFFEEGPVVQVKSRTGEPLVLSHKEKEVIYDGPLIVMVNSFSASASEILAAALQDYKRAIIVGGKSTFGKGTVQRFYDLDRMARGNNEYKPLGELKVTTQKFYRVNGGSTQLKGVIPDIVFPDNFHYMEIGERDYDYAMEWSEIEPVDYGQNVWVVDDHLIKYLHLRSQQRISENEIFERVLENAERISQLREESLRPLNMEEYRDFLNVRESEAEEYRNLFQPLECLLTRNIMADIEYIEADSSRIARNESFMENLQKDIYIYESLAIMDDMIQGVGVKK